MRRALHLGIVLATFAGSLLAQASVPVDCSPDVVRSWQPFTQELRAAKPGNRIYAPKPFPVSESEVVADFVYGYTQVMWKGTPLRKLPTLERPLYKGIQDGSLSYQVTRVENWSNNRCLRDQPRRFNYLLTIASKTDGREIARMALEESGLVAVWLISPSDEAGRAQAKAYHPPHLREAVEQVSERFGVQAAQPRYVSTSGEIRCSPLVPCIAFQAGEMTYILDAGVLFAFGPGSRRLTPAQMSRRDLLAKAGSALDPREERLISVGTSPWVVARRVPALEEKVRRP